MDAKFPETDPEFDPKKRKRYKQNIRENLLPNLEKQRKKMLSEDFQPNKDWWGSKTTIE